MDNTFTFKFTPGPWHFDAIHPDNGRIQIGSPKDFIAEMYPGNEEQSEEEQQANATLISAAPDLLKAALWLFEDAEDRNETRDEVTGELHDDWQAIYDAIQKATGYEYKE